MKITAKVESSYHRPDRVIIELHRADGEVVYSDVLRPRRRLHTKAFVAEIERLNRLDDAYRAIIGQVKQ